MTGASGEDAAASGDLDINDDVIIVGAGAATTIIDGDNNDRVFHIRNSASAVISGITIQDGVPTGSGGAGVRIENSSTLSLSDAILTNNNGTGGDGGGFHVHGTLNLDRVLLNNNVADAGAGIYFHGADGGSLTNVTISGNTSSGNGGGLWTDTAISIKNSTITLNNGNNGGGIFANGATVTISNTIVSDNTATSANDDVIGTYSSDGSNLIESVGGASGFVGGDMTGASANLVALADNGGPTRTHALLVGNLAIDAGTAAGAPAVDQRGFARVGTPDIGAFEFTSVNQAPVNVVPVAQATNQDTTLVFSSGTSNQISITDADASGSDVEVTLTATNGTLTLVGTPPPGLTFSIGDGIGDVTMTFVGTIANINTALNGLMFIPTTSYVGAASVEVTTKDQGNTGTDPLDGDANITTKYTFDVDGTDTIGANDATLNNGAAVVADAERGNVLSTDGVDDHAEVPSAVTNALSQFAFSFWVKTTESGTNTFYWQRPTLFGMEITGFGSDDFAINTNNGFIGFWTGLSGTDANYLSSTTQINDNQWHQITVSNNGANASLYVDGVLEASLATGNGLTNLSFYIGALHASTGPPVTAEHSGFFDDVRIFDRSLTSQEVSDLYSLSDTDTVAITVNATNTAPTLDLDANNSSGATGNDYQFTFTEGDAATAIADSDSDLLDADSTTFSSVKLAISGLLDGNAETLALDGDTFALGTAVAGQDTTGGNYRVTLSTGAGTATVAITKQGGGTFSEAETETLITGIQYQHTDTSTPTDGNRLIDVIVNDGTNESASARSTINVNPVNALPIAVADGFTVFEGSTTTLNLAGNDSDADDGLDLTSIRILSSPMNGTITSINTNGTVEYTHNGSETVADSFTYTINDVAGTTSNTTTVTLTITPQNDAPIITSDGGGTHASVNILTGNTAATDVNAFDAEGSPLTYSISGGADAVLFQIDPTTGVLTFITAPNVQAPGDVGGDNIYEVIVQASDGTLTDTQAMAITVADVPFVVLSPTSDSPSESPSDNGEEDSGDSADETAGNVLNIATNSNGNFSSGNQSAVVTDPKDSTQLHNLAENDLALMEHLRDGNPVNGGATGNLMDLLQRSFGTTTLKSEMNSLLGSSSGFLKDLDQARDALNDIVATEKTYVASSIAASTGLSVGYVFWLLRSGVLLTALLSSVPAWQFVNPLLVLDTPTKKKRLKGQKDLEDDSVESMFENHTVPDETSGTKAESKLQADQSRQTQRTER